ncbi:MAG TPA: sodium:proton antiporter [Anaerolineae bacterium]|nr:sodium:proton antiporter [Anaerolineae bacterium]
MFDIGAVVELLLVALAVALFTKRTQRPYTIALVIWGLILGLLQLIDPISLSKELVLTIFLPPLLFEGALHIRAGVLRPRAGLVFGLALGGTLLTALIVGAAAHLLLGFDLLTGLLLGAMIAPTDPISVLATFRASRVDRELSTIIESESLFNDGIAVVLYVILLKAFGGAPLDPAQGLGNFLLVVFGGAVLGLGLGSLTARVLEQIDDRLVEVTLTLVVAYGAFLLAEHLHLSGVIAVAVAGLAIGNEGLLRTSETSRASIVLFWEIVAFLVNSIVFLLIGFALRLDRLIGDAGSVAIVFAVLLAGRALIVYGFGALARWRRRDLPWRWQHAIAWGGLRGAVPIALALGLPADLAGRDTLLIIVFGVVFLSLLVQGLTMPVLLRRLKLARTEPAVDEDEATAEKSDMSRRQADSERVE